MERKLIAAAVSSALALPMAAQAVEFSVSGHVNRALISVDGNGLDGDLKHVDANASESRVRFVGSEELDSGITVGVNLEVAFGSDVGSYSGDVSDDGTTAANDLRIRHKNVYVTTQGGKITLGQTQTTSDNVPYANKAGPSWLAGVSNWCAFSSGYSGPGGSPGCQSNSNGRARVLRYDSPSFGPVTVAASMGEEDYWDAMVQIAGSAGDTSYDIRAGLVGENDDNEEDVITMSGSVGFGSGTAVTGAWGANDNKDADYQYVAVDQSYGDGSIGVYYGRGEISGYDGSRWGVGVGHNVGGGATAYAGFRNMAKEGQDEITLVLLGMRVTFN
jgi:hypothetical protein